MGVFEVRNLTRQSLSGAPFAKAARAILPSWDISLVFVGTRRATHFNRALRGKKYTPNVLAYALGPHHGEVIVCPQIAKTQARLFGLSVPHTTLFLFIHGLLHLKGYRHGTTMEQCERKLLARFASGLNRTYDTTNRYWH
ncbi:MAG: rRNA maturation RNase YbeY [Parcubacteria group bacterium 21-54-25]|nr:MAG: rRNA maturation RNase YbeY [Parcubacteria group bacterium 21-54-25]